MLRKLPIFCVTTALGWANVPAAWAAPATPSAATTLSAASHNAPDALVRDGEAEMRLIEAYRLVGSGQRREALLRVERLVRDYPHFQLAQLLYGDLLATQLPPHQRIANKPPPSSEKLTHLQHEAQLRLKALHERPPQGTVPAQFLSLAPSTRHAIAVDASRARLYLFENSTTGLRLVADYYISVGKLGVEKGVEGDQRTPLGVYYIGSNLDPKSLRDFYGVGALTLNYPNPYDLRRGKTGSGIWVHGTPSAQFSRAPQATDGCVVMANTDLTRLLRQVQVRSTPVVIARQLQWVAPQSLQSDSERFAQTLQAWSEAKTSGDMQKLLNFYAPDFATYDKTTLNQWSTVLQREVQQLQGRVLALKDLSYLRWSDEADTMVVTFGEVAHGARNGPIKRQYWLRQGDQWKIFFEGVIG